MTLCEVVAREAAQTLLIILAPISCLLSLWNSLGTPSVLLNSSLQTSFTNHLYYEKG